MLRQVPHNTHRRHNSTLSLTTSQSLTESTPLQPWRNNQIPVYSIPRWTLGAIERSNHMVTDFILLGFTTDPVIQLVLFVVFLGVYSVTLLRNNIPIMLICSDAQLHTFLYFFTGNLSFLDLLYSSVYNPNILVTCFSEDKSISFCRLCDPILLLCWVLLQLVLPAGHHGLWPLCGHHEHPALCSGNAQDTDIYLVVFSYTGGFLSVIILTSYTFTLDFCDDYIIDDFFCDVPPWWSWCMMWETATSLCCISYCPATSLPPPCSSWPPSSSSLLPSWGSTPPRAALRLSPYSPPTSSLSPCIIAPSSTSTFALIPAAPLWGTRWFPPFILCCSSCWTPWFYSLRNKEVKEALKKLFIAGWCLIHIHSSHRC